MAHKAQKIYPGPLGKSLLTPGLENEWSQTGSGHRTLPPGVLVVYNVGARGPVGI